MVLTLCNFAFLLSALLYPFTLTEYNIQAFSMFEILLLLRSSAHSSNSSWTELALFSVSPAEGLHNIAYGLHKIAYGLYNIADGLHNINYGLHNIAYGLHNIADRLHNNAYGMHNIADGLHNITDWLQNIPEKYCQAQFQQVSTSWAKLAFK